VFQKILTVCTGNICRSPVAEYLLQHELKNGGRSATVQSAGIGALVHHPADETALMVMTEQGISMEAHHARQISLEHSRWADLILVMENHHLEYVLRFDPTARGKTFLLGHWSKREVPDPYRKGEMAHRNCYAMIGHEVKSWLGKF
jgi:protein-tyrosine phosphatase